MADRNTGSKHDRLLLDRYCHRIVRAGCVDAFSGSVSFGYRLLRCFTTMSSLIYETAEMFRDSEYLRAITYAGGSFLLSMATFVLGFTAVRIVIKLGGGLWS